MENKEVEISQELDALRQQYAAMKEDLDKQKIINDQILEKAFQKNIGTITTDKKISFVAGFLALIVTPAIGILKKAPVSFTILAEFFIIVVLVYNYFLYRKYDINKILAYDIRSSITGIKQYRKAFSRFEIITCTVLVVLLLSFIPKIYSAWSTPAKAICAVALIIVIIFLSIYLESIHAKKVLTSCDEILDRLSEMQEKQA